MTSNKVMYKTYFACNFYINKKITRKYDRNYHDRYPRYTMFYIYDISYKKKHDFRDMWAYWI